MKIPKLILLLAVFVPAVLVFKQFFLPGSLAWGDAPHFFSEEAGELLREPQASSSTGNNLGGVNNFLWISPLMLLYGFLAFAISLGNDLAIRLVFYFPAVIFASVGSYLFARAEKLSVRAAFFASLLYTLNTYFILLVDGGQVGLALAYGFFPVAFYFLRKGSLAPATIALFLQTLFDPRIAVILTLSYLLLETVEKKLNFRYLLLLVILSLFLNLYWVVPFVSAGASAIPAGSATIQVNGILNGLTLFQPHWPSNVFGQISPPPFYFVAIPLLFLPSLFSKDKKPKAYFAVVLVASFLLSGAVPFSELPFGGAFRDTSKFFIPIALFAGLLVGNATQSISDMRLQIGIYVLLLLLVTPALLGKLNFVLSGRAPQIDLVQIKQEILKEDGFARVAWFPERHPMSFHTSQKQALDAKNLVGLRPLARINAGSFDKFNYMDNKNFLDWYSLLGIGKLVYSGDPRVITLSEKQQEEVEMLQKRIETAQVQLKIPKPQLFAVDKLLAVVGSDDVYDKLMEQGSNRDIADQAVVFFEDGKWDPRSIMEVSEEAATIVFNNKDQRALSMSFLQEYFIPTSSAVVNQWAKRDAGEYLRYKYELLINGVEFEEFDYGKGVSFSTVADEELSFDINVASPGDYILVVRAGTQGSGVKIRFAGAEDTFTSEGFGWFTKGVKLDGDSYELKITNIGGASIVNVVGVVPAADWNETEELAKKMTARFGVTELAELTGFESRWSGFTFEKSDETGFNFELGGVPESANWLILTDSFSNKWKLRRGVDYFGSVPSYSAINAFYIEPDWQDTSIEHSLQEDFRWGVFGSVVTLLILAIVYLWKTT